MENFAEKSFVQIKVEKEVFDEQVSKVFAESKKQDVKNRIKHEPSVEFVLILPRKEDPDEYPRPIKEETENIGSDCEIISDSDEESDHDKEKENVNVENVNAQKKASSTKKQYMCTKCTPFKAFKSKQAVKLHQEKMHLFCIKCKTAFKHMNALKTHDCHVGGKMCPIFKCEYCSKQFESRGNLSQHIAIHLETMKEACKKCGKKFVKNRLKQHMEFTHGAKKTFECDLCSIKLKAKYLVESHMKSHLRPYKCKVCNKTFSESRYFLEHQLNHDNPNPFKCSKCSSSYTRKTSLNRHMQTAHSSARNFPCSKCKYKGKTQDDLTTHIKSHTQAYKCDICTRKFSRSSLLKQHRILHDNPDAYQCPNCKFSFKDKKTLKGHMNKKQGTCKMRRVNKKRKLESDTDSESSSKSD